MSELVHTDRAEKHSGITRLISQALSETGNLQWRRFSSLRSRLRFGYKATGLAIDLDDLSGTNEAVAAEIYRGKFNFAGTRVERASTGIFTHQPDNPHWRRTLLSFGWLADMKVSGRELSRVQSRALISEWIALGGDNFIARRFSDTYDTGVLAKRLIAFTQNSRFLINGATEPFCARFYGSVSRQAKLAYSRSYSEPDALKRLQIHMALAYVCLGFSGYEPLRRKVFARLSAELDKQIFGDGGHISRNPQTLRDLLAILVPLRSGLENSQIEIPAAFNHALERMLPALRFFTCPDGGLTVFNGVSDTQAGLVRRILAADNVNGRPLTHAPHSGYARLQQGKASLMMDVGAPRESTVAGKTANGLFGFEFCDGPSRLVTNCGIMKFADEHWQIAARSPQAHSSLCIADAPPVNHIDNRLVRAVCGGPVAFSTPDIDFEMISQRQGTLLVASHNGYASRFGFSHTRQLFLSADGHDLRGTDILIANPGNTVEPNAVPYTIRFHLHPSVSATISRDGASAVLMLADKSGWRFSARGAQLKMEESVYLPQDGRVRKTVQLALASDTSRNTKVQWAFKRIEKRKPTRGNPADNETMALL